MVKPNTSPEAQRNINTASEAFFNALEETPEAQRRRAAREALDVIQDVLKHRKGRAKIMVTRAKVRAKRKERENKMSKNISSIVTESESLPAVSITLESITFLENNRINPTNLTIDGPVLISEMRDEDSSR